MYIPNLKEYHDCTPIDIAKQRDIYVSEVQDAIVELSRTADIYTFAITNNPKSIADGTDVIFSTSEGNYVWFPDGEFELIENNDSHEIERDESGMPTSDQRDHKKHEPWDYLRKGDYQTYKDRQRRQDSRKRNKYAQAIRHALIAAGVSPDVVYVNKRAHDLAVKVAEGYTTSVGTREDIKRIIETEAANLGINVTIKIQNNPYAGTSIITSVPYYE